MHDHPLVGDDGLYLNDALRRLGRILGEEGDAGGVVLLGRQLEVDDGSEEGVGDLHEDPGAVAGVGVGSVGAAVLEVAQRSDAELDDLVAALALEMRDEADSARVVLE